MIYVSFNVPVLRCNLPYFAFRYITHFTGMNLHSGIYVYKNKSEIKTFINDSFLFFIDICTSCLQEQIYEIQHFQLNLITIKNDIRCLLH